MKVVVDTNILIDHLRDGMIWRNFLAQAGKEASFFIPTIVIFELFSGDSTRNTYTSQKVTNLIKQFKLIGLTKEIGQRAGELYRDVNKTLQVPDYIIAASALEIGGTILTLNKKTFQPNPTPFYISTLTKKNSMLLPFLLEK